MVVTPTRPRAKTREPEEPRLDTTERTRSDAVKSFTYRMFACIVGRQIGHHIHAIVIQATAYHVVPAFWQRLGDMIVVQMEIPSRSCWLVLLTSTCSGVLPPTSATATSGCRSTHLRRTEPRVNKPAHRLANH